MSLLGNPVPTSGEIRDMRRRMGRRFGPLVLSTDLDATILVAAGDVVANVSDGVTGVIPNSRLRVRQLLAEPRVWRLVDRVALAGRAGLDTIEQMSDETHDTVEESLARLSGWPRAAIHLGRSGRPHGG